MNFKNNTFRLFFIGLILLVSTLMLSACGLNSAQGNSNLVGEESVINKANELKEKTEERAGNVTNEIEKVEKTETQKKVENLSSSKLPELQVDFLDVGQADSALIQFSNHAILIDAGDWNKNEVVPYLKNKGIKKLDLVVGTHAHADHIGQMDKVINNFKVDEVWMSGGTSTSAVLERTLVAIDKSGARYNEPRAGENYQIGDLKINVLSPRSITGNLNDDSIVMKLTYGKTTFLFTGDAESPSESKMVSSGQNLKSTILKVGHHGSDTSTSQSFLNKVDPEVAVISVSEKSKYNHPNKSTVDKLKEKGIKVYATKTHGNIVIKTDGKSYKVSKDREGEVTPGDIGKTSSKPSNQQSSAVTVNNGFTEKQPIKVTETTPVSGCVDINSASEGELQNIKHIGPATSPKVVSERPFESVDDLTKVSGIGPKKIEDIKAEGKACVK